VREPVPEAVVSRLDGAAQHREPVDARSEHGKQGGERDDGREHSEHGGGDAGVGERSQEVLGEDEQRRQRRCHGEPREEHGAPGGLHAPHHGLVGRPTLAHLLAVARDDEEGVVDAEAERQARHEVDGEDRHVSERRQHEQG
jgi:hypothetical protein